MLGNSIGWVIYGTLTSDPYCFISSAPGVCLACWINLAAVKLIYQEHARKRFRAFINGKNCKIPKKQIQCIASSSATNTSSKTGVFSSGNTSISQVDGNTFEQLLSTSLEHMLENTKLGNPPLTHDALVVSMVAFWAIVIAVLIFVPIPRESQIFLVGVLANTILVLFFVGPLSRMYTIVKLSDSSSIHRPTMMINMLSSIIWASYGIGRKDLFMYVPNIIGAALGFLQLVLCAVYPVEDKNRLSTKQERHQSNELKEYGTCVMIDRSREPPIQKSDQFV
jgi:solute carrier family 50 protein (sugar transporter)